MPLSAELAKVVDLIEDPTEREATRKRLTELEEGGLRQSDYSKKMNELDERDKAREAEHQKAKKWHENNQAFYKQAISERDTAQKELEKATERLKQLQARSDSGADDLDPDDAEAVARALKEAREKVALHEQSYAKLEERLNKVDQMIANGELITREEAGRQLNAFGSAVLNVTDYQRMHEKEFGSELDRAALLKIAEENGGNLEVAYKQVTEEARLEKMKADIRAETRKEMEEEQRKNSTPLAPGSGPTLGPLQEKVFETKKGEESIDPKIPLDGSGRLATAMAREMRAEGKG